MDEILTIEQWAELRFRLKQKYPELTETDLEYCEAGEKDLLQMIEYEHRRNIGNAETVKLTSGYSPGGHLRQNRLIYRKCRIRQQPYPLESAAS